MQIDISFKALLIIAIVFIFMAWAIHYQWGKIDELKRQLRKKCPQATTSAPKQEQEELPEPSFVDLE